MRTRLIPAVLAATLVVAALPAHARPRSPAPRGRGSDAAFASEGPGRERIDQRGGPYYGQTGPIHWNTPNADGNLGGPGTGGSGGGGQ